MNVLPASSASVSAPAPASLPARPSLEANFGWALGGNVWFAACQWGMLIALARLGSPKAVGQFSLGLAIATPIITFSNLQLRSVQATDAAHRYRFAEYLQLRRKTTFMALVAILAVTIGAGWRLPTALVVLAVALSKAVESLSDIHYGLFQNREELGTIAKSMVLRGTLGVGVLAAVLYLTGSAIYAVAGLVVVWALVLLRFDIRRGGGIPPPAVSAKTACTQYAATRWTNFLRPLLQPGELGLAGAAFPLGVVTALMSLQMNVPRYFVEWRSGEVMLGIFSATAYLGTLLTVFIDAMGLAVTPRLAKLFHSGHSREFRKLAARLVALAALAGLSGTSVAAVAGGAVLRLAYGSEYAAYREIFVWLMAAAGIGCIGTMLCCALTAGGCFRAQVPLYAAVVSASAIACAVLAPRYGIRGAAMAMVIASAVHVILSTILVRRMLNQTAVHQSAGASAMQTGRADGRLYLAEQAERSPVL